jgi:hypothetical protein
LIQKRYLFPPPESYIFPPLATRRCLYFSPQMTSADIPPPGRSIFQYIDPWLVVKTDRIVPSRSAVVDVAVEGGLPLEEVLRQQAAAPHQRVLRPNVHLCPVLDLLVWDGPCLLKGDGVSYFALFAFNSLLIIYTFLGPAVVLFCIHLATLI